MKIYCCCCNEDIEARITSGKHVYPHRKDLYSLQFWICYKCGNFVGCHKSSGLPLGCIPTDEIKKARIHIHNILDPLWKNKLIKRGELYKIIKKKLGYEYHTANIRSIDEARNVYRIILEIKSDINK